MYSKRVCGRAAGNEVRKVAWVLSLFRRVRLCVTLWSVAPQASLPMGILQARIVECVAMPSSRGSS